MARSNTGPTPISLMAEIAAWHDAEAGMPVGVPQRTETSEMRPTSMCTRCEGTGRVSVSYADPENGPTDDPADEIGTEYCECPFGDAAWREDCEASERAEAEMRRMQSPVQGDLADAANLRLYELELLAYRCRMRLSPLSSKAEAAELAANLEKVAEVTIAAMRAVIEG